MPEAMLSSTYTPKLTRINSSASNVKFGKLTLQRGPNNKDLGDVRTPVLNDTKRSKVSRNSSPNHLAQSSKSKLK